MWKTLRSVWNSSYFRFEAFDNPSFIKILREVGTASYIEASTRLLGPEGISFRRTYDTIVHTLVGPDVYWAGGDMPERRERTTRWGSAVCIPSPPTVVSSDLQLVC